MRAHGAASSFSVFYLGLLVVGWYLLSPPVAGNYSFNPDAPRARISPVGEASEFSRAMFKGAVLSVCVTSDDFRLR